MKVKIFVLQYGNKFDELTAQNILNAGDVPFDLQSLNISPLAKALNTGLADFAKGYDAIGFLANDIEEPQDWLKKRIDYLKENPNCGIVSIYPTSGPIPNSPDIIGNYLIRRELFETIGFFTEEFNEYGPMDLDYCTRARCAGFTTEYIPNLRADHKDWNKENEYGFSKSEKVKENWPIHVQNVNWYLRSEKAIKIIYPEYTINQSEWPTN